MSRTPPSPVVHPKRPVWRVLLKWGKTGTGLVPGKEGRDNDPKCKHRRGRNCFKALTAKLERKLFAVRAAELAEAFWPAAL